MTINQIVESGMTFGPYPKGHCFFIEKSATYKKIQNNVQIAEFLLLRHTKDGSPVVWVVEAKSSSPKPATLPNFDGFIIDIHEKLMNAFSLGIAICLNRHKTSQAELPDLFKTLDLSIASVRFVLVVKGHREEWLPPLQEALSKALNSTIKTNIWNFLPLTVAVINDDLALKYGLISSIH